jgi:apolipoprotein N-acyltransferase
MNKHPHMGDGLALLGGMVFPLGFAPFNLWPVCIGSLVLLLWTLDDASKRRTIVRYYLFSLGMYGVGASWIYVSINVYGGASPLLAGFLIVAFIAAYSLTSLIAAGCHLAVQERWRLLLFPAVLVLLEWFRSWFLTGFPWLFTGYSQMESPLAGFAPVTGVLGLSFLCALIAALLYLGVSALIQRTNQQVAVLNLALVVVVLFCSHLLRQVNWVTATGDLQVSAIQGNIDQHTKWQRNMVGPILQTYLNLSENEWGRQLVVWPEASITLFREDAAAMLSELQARGDASDTTLVLGIPDRDSEGHFLNTAIALGSGSGSYHKRRLVPFGEYVPLENQLRGVISFFDLPMSRNKAGPDEQAPLLAADLRLSLSICYEVVYPELVRGTVTEPDVLVTISNDTWFGRSIGPRQHIQMASMRALENGRWMVRATNNGITALIDHHGKIRDQLPTDTPGVLRGTVQVMQGATPYHRWGQWPLLGLCFILLAVGIAPISRKRGS